MKLMNGFRNLKVRTKIIIMAVFMLLVMIFLAGLAMFNQANYSKTNLKNLEEEIRSGYDQNIKNQVENAVSLINTIYNRQVAGELTEEEAKKLAADLIREIRYGDNGYFWIDTYEGVNVVLLGNETEGTNRYNTKDSNGYEMIKAIIANGKQEGGGYTDYWFPKAGETVSLPKRSYSLAFEPYQWVVGTGNYTDYIDEEVKLAQKEQKDLLAKDIAMYSIILLISLAFAISITTFISRMLNRDLKSFSGYLDTLATGDFTIRLSDDYMTRKDDFGGLARNLEGMKNAVAKLVGSAKYEADNILDVMEHINVNIQDLNSNIEDVAATTEELAASMEETAASAQEMTATSSEIETATRSIAEKSQEAALEIVKISKRASDTRAEVEATQSKTSEMKNRIEEKLSEALEKAKIVSEINVLTEAIMGITAQTNLLALNASIEAARAGESGKGFAVVADEIRNLANQSKAAVAKIQEVTQEVTDAVQNLSGNADELLQFVSKDITENFNNLAEVARAYMNDAIFMDGIVTDFSATSEELLASITNIMTAVSEVANAASEGASGTNDIAEKIAVITDKSSEVAKEALSSGQSSENLRREISSFKVS
jgi:methyl-accepting chemotaxis protein